MPSNKAPGNDTTHIKILKDCLNSIVHPITSIINSSFLTGSFPSQWKQSEIIPIPKNDDYEEAENNRPISLLPVLSKVCERAVHNQFTSHLIQTDRFPTNQSGNRKQHSTETLGLSISDYILDAMDKKRVTAMVLLDFSKAFDSISHPLLLSKLKNFGVSPNVLQWFASYLSQRKQQVRIGKTLSTTRIVTHGVPQGSILGPLLFNLYIHDLHPVCTGSEIDSFVDDTKLYMTLKVADLADGLNCLTNDLNRVASWCCFNQLLINPGKTQFILFGTRQLLQQKPADLQLSFLGKVLRPSKCVKDLGIKLDEHLSFDDHTSKVVSSCNLALKQISRVKHLFDQKTLVFIIQSLVFSKLFYCSTVWSNTSNKNITRLQRVQNYAARIVTKTRKFDHITPVLKQLKWIPVSDVLYLREAVMTYKCINNIGPNYLCSKVMSCQLKKRPYSLRNEGYLRPPKFRTTTGQRAFIYRACKIWNSIEESLKQCPNVSLFKYKLKNMLVNRFILT